MKTKTTMIMRNIFYVFITACLLVLGTTQAQAVEYSKPYTSFRFSNMQANPNAKKGLYTTTSSSTTAIAPSMSFQSTSSMQSSHTNSALNTSVSVGIGATPMLNSDGSVSAGAYMAEQVVSGPHRIVNPDEDDEDDTENGTPLGDAVLPLLLMAAAFCLMRRKEMV